jgi:hypothetical protein
MACTDALTAEPTSPASDEAWMHAAGQHDHDVSRTKWQHRHHTHEEPSMRFAADYPFLNIFWTMIIFFTWVCWIMLVIRVFADIFRQRDMSGWAKAAWSVFVILLPFVGVLIYVIAKGKAMAGREVQRSRAAQTEFDDYVKTVAGSSGPAADIDKAKQLLEAGTIDQTEYSALKAKALA